MKQGRVIAVLPGRVTLVALLSLALLCPALARQDGANRQPKGEPPPRTLYRITLELDFDARTYTGRERVRWVNRDDRPASVVYFHLYPNLRAEDERPGAQDIQAAPAEPRLEVTAVRAGEGGQALPFNAEDDGVTLRVQLREAVAPGS